VCSSLLRFADIEMRWTEDDYNSTMCNFASLPRLRSIHMLECSGYSMSTAMQVAHWLGLSPHISRELAPKLPSSQLHGLTALRTDSRTIATQRMSLLATSCPNLRLLHLRVLPLRYYHIFQTYFRELANLQARMPLLTDIGIEAETDQVEELATLTQITHLSLNGLQGRAWGILLSAPTMHSLQQLTLKNVTAKPLDMVVGWKGCLSQMRLLHTLVLEQCWSVDDILLAIPRGADSSLRSLRIAVWSDGLSLLARRYKPANAIPFVTSAPRVAIINTLLKTCSPLLVVNIQIEVEADHVAACIDSDNNAIKYYPTRTKQDWMDAYKRYTSCAQQSKGRVRFQCGFPKH